jgi:hypothetical protein
MVQANSRYADFLMNSFITRITSSICPPKGLKNIKKIFRRTCCQGLKLLNQDDSAIFYGHARIAKGGTFSKEQNWLG